jgi:hypothetical protein
MWLACWIQHNAEEILALSQPNCLLLFILEQKCCRLSERRFLVKGEDVDFIFVWGGGGEGTDVPTSLTSHT